MISSSRRKKQFGSQARRKKGINWTNASRVLLTVFLLMALSGGVAGTVFGIKKWMNNCSYFLVSFIEIQGAKRLDKKDIIDISGIKTGDNIFGIDLKAVSERLTSRPWIKSADVERKLPDAILINIQEREPVALAKVGEKLFLVDKDGTCFKCLTEKEQFSAPVISGIETNSHDPKGDNELPATVDRSRMADALKIIKMSRHGVRALGFNNISQIDFPNDHTVVIYTADRAVPFYINRDGLKKQFYRAEKILFQLYNSGQYPKVVSVNVGYGNEMALARLKKK